MNYETFKECPIGTVKTLSTENGFLRFVKSDSNHWLIEFAVRTEEPFVYTRFSTVCPRIEASCLFDHYSKK